MRKMLPLAAVLMLGMTTAATQAQFTINGARITNGSNTNAAASNVPTFSMTQMVPRMSGAQMIPRVNGAQLLGSPLSGAQKSGFSLTKMIPNFSWLRTRLWPIASPRAQSPTSPFGASPFQVR